MTDTALFADLEARTLRGLLLPFGELSQRSVSKTEPIMFAAGTVTIPEDVTVLNANRLHSQHAPVARFMSVTETPAGLEAEFAVARGADGDALLAEATDPDPAKRPRLSAEVRDLVRSGARAVRATLTGAAFVPRGAFASAALFELADGEEIEEAPDPYTAPEAASTSQYVTEFTDEHGVKWRRTEENSSTTTVEKVGEPTDDTQDPDAAPAEDNQEGQFAMPNATVPAGVQAPVTPKKTANGLFAAIASKDFDAMKAYSIPESPAMFAIEGLQQSGPSTVTIGADTAQVGYLGEIWDGNPYERKFWGLFDLSPLTSWKAVGWKWDPTKSPEVAAYAGNLAEIASHALDTSPVEVTAQRVAGGNRLDRRYIDFNDQQVIASYYSKLTEHYKRFTDAAALAAAVTAAGADLDVTGKSYPYGSPVAVAAIIDGALKVLADEATPSFAVVSPELWRDIALIGRNDVLGYLQAGFGLESGSVEGFKILPGAVGTGKVLVGAKQGLQVFELGGSPIRVDALAVHNGAMDGALYGYYATLDTGLGLSIVDTTDYTAPEPPTTIVVEPAA